MNLQSATIFYSGPYFTTDVKSANWKFTGPGKLKVRAISLWTGMGIGYRADSNFAAFRKSDGSLLAQTGYDRYADSPLPLSIVTFYCPADTWFEFAPGDEILFSYFTRPLWKYGQTTDPINLCADHSAVIYYDALKTPIKPVAMPEKSLHPTTGEERLPKWILSPTM